MHQLRDSWADQICLFEKDQLREKLTETMKLIFPNVTELMGYPKIDASTFGYRIADHIPVGRLWNNPQAVLKPVK